MKKMIWVLLLLMSNIVFAQTTNTLTKFGKVITTEGLKQKLSVIASAEMEGRETGTPGQKRAAAYIESEFKRMGLQPGNGQSYQQIYPVYQDVLVEKKLIVGGKTFEWDKDFNFSLQSISSGNWNYTEVIFAGYGIVDPSKNINDYENFVSKIHVEDHEDKPQWMGHVDFTDLKIKLISSIVAISGIHLLKIFMNLDKYSKDTIILYVVVHLTFVVSGVLLAMMDYIMNRSVSKHSKSKK